MEDNWKKFWAGFSLLLTFIFLVIFALICYEAVQIKFLKQEIRLLESELKSANNSNSELRADFDKLKVEFEIFKNLTSYEFKRNWESFRAVRNNFLAFGIGMHLEKDDIAPDETYEIYEAEEKIIED